MFFAIFRKLFVLYVLSILPVFGQSIDNTVVIELGQTNFSIERPFVITVSIPNSESRPAIAFPDIPGFNRKGTSASVTTSEVGGKTITNQIITQNYQAQAPGRYRLVPFVIVVNGSQVRSEGAELLVRPSAGSASAASVVAAVPKNAAFLSLSSSKSTLYAGEGVGVTLSFFVADNYPFELNFTVLDKQVQAITKRIRPVNAWEENRNITVLKPVSVLVGGKKFREFRLYQAVYFPLAARPLNLPAVSLQLARRPVIGPPSAQPELVSFTSQPIHINVRPLPPHPLKERVPVGSFRLEEGLSRRRVSAGQSVRYTVAIAGEGNIATLPAPKAVAEQADLDIFPPEERHTINRADNRITGRKTFSYFLVPHQNGTFSLANRLQWVYFDPQKARYDTLRPKVQLTAGASEGATSAVDSVLSLQRESESIGQAGRSLYAGIERLNSADQPIQFSQLVRAVANVLIVLMLLGMIFVFFRK